MNLPCPQCGARFEHGESDCEIEFQTACLRPIGAPSSWLHRRLLVDAYAVQHPDRYCASDKSLAAHLGGLCAWVDHGPHPAPHRALLDWLDGRRELVRPALPAERGALTIASIAAAADGAELAAAVERWARSVWEACQPLHPIAREWVKAALERRA